MRILYLGMCTIHTYIPLRIYNLGLIFIPGTIHTETSFLSLEPAFDPHMRFLEARIKWYRVQLNMSTFSIRALVLVQQKTAS